MGSTDQLRYATQTALMRSSSGKVGREVARTQKLHVSKYVSK